MGAIIIGLVSGVAWWFCSTVVKKALGYDDSYDVFGIHGVGGIVGALLTGLLCVPVLADVEPGMQQLGIQFYGILLTIGWCAIATFVILKAIDITIIRIGITKSPTPRMLFITFSFHYLLNHILLYKAN